MTENYPVNNIKRAITITENTQVAVVNAVSLEKLDSSLIYSLPDLGLSC